MRRRVRRGYGLILTATPARDPAMKLLLAAALLTAPALAQAQDLSGTWTISSSVGETPITVACALAQKGEALTGTCRPAGGTDGPAFTGVVKGAHASWGYDVPFRGQPSHVGFEADIVSDAAMKGVLTLGTRPSPFTAMKQ
jgi:hypothetical protein